MKKFIPTEEAEKSEWIETDGSILLQESFNCSFKTHSGKTLQGYWNYSQKVFLSNESDSFFWNDVTEYKPTI